MFTNAGKGIYCEAIRDCNLYLQMGEQLEENPAVNE